MGWDENRLYSPGFLGLANANCNVVLWLSPANTEHSAAARLQVLVLWAGTPNCGNSTQKDGVKHRFSVVTERFLSSCKNLSHSFQMQVLLA
jgi:hypothetical protein